jgi:hypothetical protein
LSGGEKDTRCELIVTRITNLPLYVSPCGKDACSFEGGAVKPHQVCFAPLPRILKHPQPRRDLQAAHVAQHQGRAVGHAHGGPAGLETASKSVMVMSHGSKPAA